MWRRAGVVEDAMMFHNAETTGPAAMRQPAGLDITTQMSADPENPTGWQLTTDGQVIQRIPEEEFRFLVHWGADIYMDMAELKRALDHSDDLTHEQVFDTIIADLRARGEKFEMPSDPLTDKAFIGLLNRVYDPGMPAIVPPEPQELVTA